MRKHRIHFAILVGTLGLSVLISVLFNQSRTNATPAAAGLDVAAMERDGAPTKLSSFDDDYQRYMGVLDIMRAYPLP
jgi:hypothetical protein